MNPLLMNADDLVRWYKPQTEMEKHILAQVEDLQKDIQVDVEELQSQLASQAEELSGCEELKSRLRELRKELINGNFEDFLQSADALQAILEDYS